MEIEKKLRSGFECFLYETIHVCFEEIKYLFSSFSAFEFQSGYGLNG